MAYVLSQRLYTYTGLVLCASILTTLFIGGIYSLIGGVTRKPLVLPQAFAAALVTVLLPIGGSLFLDLALERLGWSASAAILGLSMLAIGVFAGAFIFGSYLALLTLLGYENTQALTVLDHPGFKHFVRLRVRSDGIDGWCIGAADPLGDGEEPVLVDQFSWRPFRNLT
ncbi:MAG: hypothetical protein ND866_20405 [Pyrinomonadaceae bacterium]|nr:hypothetical protein [Pyrinomonadaceae bacterium]